MNSTVGFLLRRIATAFKPACIAQLIQVELLRRRRSLTQIQGASLPNSQLLNSFQYISMKARPLILSAALLFLSACTAGGYSRSYIITDTTHEEVISESNENHK